MRSKNNSFLRKNRKLSRILTLYIIVLIVISGNFTLNNFLGKSNLNLKKRSQNREIVSELKNNLTDIRSSTIENFHYYYYSQTTDYHSALYQTLTGWQDLKVQFNDVSSDICLIKGIKFKYDIYDGYGGAPLKYRFNSSSILYDHYDYVPYPNFGGDAWRTFYLPSSGYILDNSTEVFFYPDGDTYNRYARLCRDNDPPKGHSLFYNEGSNGWKLDPGEYIVELIYENIPELDEKIIQSGYLDYLNDYVDAYFIDLEANCNYSFNLERTNGNANVNMRLLNPQHTTYDTLVQSSGYVYPKQMSYVPSTTQTYLLLVEGSSTYGSAGYTISYAARPIANFTANETNVMENEWVEFCFTGSSHDPIISYDWDFGDGSTHSSDQNPINQYTKAGTYDVSLTVIDDNGDVDTITKYDHIFVEGFPKAEFTTNATNIDQDQWVQFMFTGSEGNPSATYDWDFGDGTPHSSDQNPIHQYNLPGTYTINLTVIDSDDDIDMITENDFITVNGVPIAEFTVNDTNIFTGEWVKFTFDGREGDLPPQFDWDFGDGTPHSFDQNPIHQYNSEGDFNVSLTVIDNNGDVAQKKKTYFLIVREDVEPNVDFIVDSTPIDQGQWVQFTFTGSEGNPSATYDWDFGDGTPHSSDQNPTHQYNLFGNFNVTLTVIDSDDDSDTDKKVDFISVNGIPIAEFIANATNIFTGEWIQFTFNGREGESPMIYDWDFGDGTPHSSDQNPTHQYNLIGNFNLTLTVIDSDDDSDIIIKLNYIIVNMKNTESDSGESNKRDKNTGEDPYLYHYIWISLAATAILSIIFLIILKKKIIN